MRPAFARAAALKLRLFRLKVWIRTRLHSDEIDWFRPYYVDPASIEFAVVLDNPKDYNKYRHRGKVLGGDWDRRRVRCEDFGIRLLRAAPPRRTGASPGRKVRISPPELAECCEGHAPRH
ncbi:MAG: hypothetical protein QUS33_01295 [Dehalococcoidia bacterium]|nr:hypothetical protein [Dehalococcoidia bacterium]